MKRSPFKDPPATTTLDAATGVVLATGGPACEAYRPVGLRLLEAYLDEPFTEFMDALRVEHEGHWIIGLESLGWRGRSRDVSRHNALTTGFDANTRT